MAQTYSPREVAEALWSRDPVAKWFGIDLIDAKDGQAVVEMTVQPQHCNGHGVCHGGISFTLADAAFAYACNQSTMAQHNIITYTAAGQLGDRLCARATEVSLTGRSGIYDVRVTNQDKLTIAEFRGFSRVISGTILNE